MIQYKNLDLWYICTNNQGMQEELKRECRNRHHARKYINIAYHTAQLQYELEQMWEEELMCD
jgi:hypothetical protein